MSLYGMISSLALHQKQSQAVDHRYTDQVQIFPGSSIVEKYLMK